MKVILPAAGLVAAASILAWSMTAETGEPQRLAESTISEQTSDQPEAKRGHGPFEFASTTRRGWRGQGTPPAFWPAR